jgi:signal transduction histidine kinase/CheY-like chemotaxis protein
MALETALIRVVQRLSSCRELSAVMAVLREAARDFTGADGITVVLREEDVCYYAEENAVAPLWKGRRFPMKSCISGWCMMHRKQVAIADIYADPRIPHDVYRPTFVKSLAMVPIRSEDPIGAIGAYWADQHQATPDELQILQALGDSASLAFDNIQLIERLKNASRRKDEFLSMLAHELRNPLAPIRNALHLLRLGADASQKADAGSFLPEAASPDTGNHFQSTKHLAGQAVARARELMERQVQHLARLVDDLLDVARLTRGKVALRHERIDLARIVRDCAEDRRGLLQGAGLRLALELPQTPVWVLGDAVRLAQAVGNLLDNSVKFTPAGGQVTVCLSADSQTSQALVSVRDTGIGIELEMLPRLFEPFAQADHSLAREGGGLGLGLSVAKGLVELHGGSMGAASAGSGQGSEFLIRLRCEPEPPALDGQLPPRQNPIDGRSKRFRILIAEDNRDSAESLRMLLQLCGYDVTVAASGPEAVKAAAATHPDIVLCDIGLPGMDGFAVAGELRRNPDTAKARLIAVTGYGRDEDRQRALEAGFDQHLVKPVDPGQLLGQLAVAAAG